MAGFLRRSVSSIRRDLDSVVSRDPAARSKWEVGLLYPGLHAVWVHRASHQLWNNGAHLPARALSQFARFMTGVEIHPGARLGPGLFIDHGAGVVIGETAIVGSDVTIYHGVTLGGTNLGRGKRHPTIGDGVTIGAGAKVLGDITVGDNSRIGANAVLVRSVGDDSVVVGVPGQVISHAESTMPHAPAPVEQALTPDPVGNAVKQLMARVEALEISTHGHTMPSSMYARADGTWTSDLELDFSI